jgi:putative addiction module killer protein
MRTIYTTGVFDRWFGSLRDKQAARRIQVRIDRAQDGNFGDHKSVGEGVSEMRIHHGPGFRVYFTVRRTEIIIHRPIDTARVTAATADELMAEVEAWIEAEMHRLDPEAYLGQR